MCIIFHERIKYILTKTTTKKNQMNGKKEGNAVILHACNNIIIKYTKKKTIAIFMDYVT